MREGRTIRAYSLIKARVGDERAGAVQALRVSFRPLRSVLPKYDQKRKERQSEPRTQKRIWRGQLEAECGTRLFAGMRHSRAFGLSYGPGPNWSKSTT